MKLYRIEKNIKIPEVSRPAPSQSVSPTMATIQKLEKGDSFLVRDPLDAVGAAKIMRDCLARERARGGTRHFTSRKIGGGVRIWRLK